MIKSMATNWRLGVARWMGERIGWQPRFGWPDASFAPFGLIALVAAAMRLWELDGRVMHYDEAIHLHYAWKLANGVEYAHSPWMHGPFQIELVAILLKWLGDTDFVARLPYALFGVALVALPYFLRRQMGDKGAICAALIMAFSPTLLYFSRFGRNDILMAVWATLLLIFLWRYHENSKRPHLLGAAAVTALMLASKETAYFVILFMGLAALGLGWRQVWAVARRQAALADLRGAAGFFVLLATLTLPQAAAAISVVQGPLGLTLAATDSGSTGETGAPVWEAPFASLPIWEPPVLMHFIALLASLAALVAVARWVWKVRNVLDLAVVSAAGVSAVAAVAVVTLGPAQGLLPELGTTARYLDCAIGAALMAVGLAIPRWLSEELRSWRRIAVLLGAPAILTWLWLVAFGDGLSLMAQMLPAAAPAAELEAGTIAVNYLVPALTLLLLVVVGGVVGALWGGGVWIVCAGLFYVIWGTLYTTFFTNWPGVFTGGWQSLGYWLAQQEVARGNQPWYYYLVGMTVYEALALVFGLAAVVWLIRRREPFGVVLAAWVIATMAIYTIAAEKMPWLLVNITVPLALAAGMLLGNLMDGIRWPLQVAERWRTGLLLALSPVWILTAVWIVWLLARGGAGYLPAWLTAMILLPMAVGIAWLVRVQPNGGRLMALGVAGLLLIFGTVAAMRAAYTYDDSNVEILAYAQGSADLVESYAALKEEAWAGEGASARVEVDYDMWYPFQWYVRQETEAGTLRFDRFCAAGSDGGSDSCKKVGEDTGPVAYLTEKSHAVEEQDAGDYRREGPMRNLLWYPETYRRPEEARTETAMWRQLTADVEFFTDSAVSREKWQQAIEYIVARRQDSDWYTAEYYQYFRR